MKQSIYIISLSIFLISIALFRLPYLYLFPGISSAFLTTQSVARILLVMGFCIGVIFFKKKIHFSKDGVVINLLVLGFFLVSSLSILYAQNLESFIVRYKDFIIGIVSFYTFYFFRNEKKKIVYALIITMPIMIMYQLILLYGNVLHDYIIPLIYQKHFDIVSYNLSRGRIYVDSYDEAFIPMIFLVFTFKKRIHTFWGYVMLGCLSFLAFISNFRTRIGMLGIGIIGIFIVFRERIQKKFLFFFMLLLGTSVLISTIFSMTLGANFLDRFFLRDEIQDIATIETRVDQIFTALPMGFISPFGVGLGNYYDNLPNNKIKSYALIDPANVSAREYIHNNLATVIAESGYIAFIIFLLLLVKFMQNDYEVMKKKNYYKRAFVFAFWTLFFFGFFNPPIPISYQVLFWGMRGLLV